MYRCPTTYPSLPSPLPRRRRAALRERPVLDVRLDRHERHAVILDDDDLETVGRRHGCHHRCARLAQHDGVAGVGVRIRARRAEGGATELRATVRITASATRVTPPLLAALPRRMAPRNIPIYDGTDIADNCRVNTR